MNELIDNTGHKDYMQYLAAYDKRDARRHKMKVETRNIEDVLPVMLDLHDVQKIYGFGLDVFGMFSAFEHQHKEKHGSLKPYVMEDDYFEKYNKRQIIVIQCINEVIESRLDFEKKSRQEYHDHLKLHDYLETLNNLK